MANRALVTGGSGYFGSVLVDALGREGYDVRVFDLNPPDPSERDVDFVQGDILDRDAILKACTGMDVVHHNVAQVPLAKDRALFWAVNHGGTENLLVAARNASVKKVVHTSTSAIFGVPKRNPVDETTEPTPMEEYGKAKLAGEQLVQRFAAEHRLDVTIIRPRTIVGHGRLGIFQILYEWIRRGSNVPVLGRGDNRYQFVHADDLAGACILAGDRAGAAIYHAGTDRFGTMRETLEALCRHAGTGSRVRSVPMAPAVWGMKLTSVLGLSPLGAYHSLMYGRSMWFSIDKARGELGWAPRYSNDEMLIEGYAWYLAHRDEVMRTTGASHHRSPVRQGVLELVRRAL